MRIVNNGRTRRVVGVVNPELRGTSVRGSGECLVVAVVRRYRQVGSGRRRWEQQSQPPTHVPRPRQQEVTVCPVGNGIRVNRYVAPCRVSKTHRCLAPEGSAQ